MNENFTIVCVDDEENVLELYENHVVDKGFQFEKFLNPEDALAYIKENHKKIALIISDFKMPEMTGFELREKMLSFASEVPFILVTGFYDKEMATEGMKLRIARFFEKPYIQDELDEVIGNETNMRIESLNEEREMVSEFLDETSPMLEEIEDLILTLEDDPSDSRAVNTYFRLLHTIKGTSSCLGLTEISEYAHLYEELITKVQKGELGVNAKVTNVLLKGLDDLKKLYSISENFEPFPEDLDKWTNIFDQDFSGAEAEVKTSDSGEKAFAKEVKTEKQDEKLSISVEILTEFLENSGELTVLRNTVFKNLIKLQQKYHGDKELEILSENLSEMGKISSLLQNQIADMKKVSLDSVFRPMKRVVRDASTSCEKEVHFTTEGEKLRVDTAVGKLLNNVLVHLLRNAVDHGIEGDVEDRIKAGKDEKGSINLNCFETGENIFVEITDDGGGIDPEIIRNKAIEKGLYTHEEMAKWSDNKILSLIFESGFSTNSEVTSISGRGVGMDMVRSSVEEMGGKIHIDSTLGQGTKFVLVVPIPRSIVIINSLMVNCQGRSFCVPLDDVAEVVLIGEDGENQEKKIFKVEDTFILKHHGDLIPLIDLQNTLGLTDQFCMNEIQNIVILKGDGFRFGLLVDGIEDIEEVVVKGLGPFFKDQYEYLGATFIGDGELAMILSSEGLAKRFGIENLTDQEEEFFNKENENISQDNEFMRFHLKEFKNYALPLHWVNRLEEISSDQVQFSGKRPLVQYRGSALPLIFIEPTLGLHYFDIPAYLKKHNKLHVIVLEKNNRLYGAVIDELLDIGIGHEALNTNTADREGIMGTIFIDGVTNNVVSADFLLANFDKQTVVPANKQELVETEEDIKDLAA